MTNEAQPGPNETPEEEQAMSFKLLVTVVLAAVLLFAAFLLYSGATGVGTFRKTCDAAKGKSADAVIGELVAIGATASAPSANGTVTVAHKDGPRCVVRVSDTKVFSSLFEE